MERLGGRRRKRRHEDKTTHVAAMLDSAQCEGPVVICRVGQSRRPVTDNERLCSKCLRLDVQHVDVCFGALGVWRCLNRQAGRSHERPEEAAIPPECGRAHRRCLLRASQRGKDGRLRRCDCLTEGSDSRGGTGSEIILLARVRVDVEEAAHTAAREHAVGVAAVLLAWERRRTAVFGEAGRSHERPKEAAMPPRTSPLSAACLATALQRGNDGRSFNRAAKLMPAEDSTGAQSPHTPLGTH